MILIRPLGNITLVDMCYDNRIKARPLISKIIVYIKNVVRLDFCKFHSLLQTYFPYAAWHKSILLQQDLVCRKYQCPNRRKWHFQGSSFQNFLGEHFLRRSSVLHDCQLGMTTHISLATLLTRTIVMKT